MSGAKHTPGPWEVTDQNGDPEGNFRGVRRPTQINSLGKPYNMYVAQYCSPADARLISAAPELLEALREAEELLAQTLRWRGEGWECSEDELLGRIRAAIAKATRP